ncbi:unnamed protein product [Nezara viridula]|uniref:Kelch domain-containing protein 4 n=1 Tax=Nezara viridula TaxID=85310 RepID=A0A9P0H6I4_NEZVI|nr:unnamed protein product [Nezara viridula]
MGKQQKKKGKGVEKTSAKTEKKLTQKMKKKLALTGEDDIEDIVKQIEKEEQKKLQVIEKVIATPPTRRAFCSLTAHPYKDELIMFGGELHNGHETFVYNDLYVYKIATDEWTLIKSPGAPPPRTSHQAVATSANKGELWLFGGEFTTRSESQFYHYKDLWLFELETKKWTKIDAPGAPSSRSGHRMVVVKRQIIVFGGYHDNLQDYKYFNDVHAFNLDSRTWKKLDPTGTPPSPRSGCQMVSTPEGKIVIWGGYSKIKIKKDVDKGTTHTDTFLLQPEKGDETGLKWKWSIVKPGGARYGARSGVSCTFWGKKAYTFGGAADNETEEDLSAVFYNQLHSFDLHQFIWSEIALKGKKEQNKPRRRRRNKDDDCEDEENDEEMQVEEEPLVEEKVVEDGVFTMRVSTVQPTKNEPNTSSSMAVDIVSHPHSRINCSLAIKGHNLFMYGGVFEEGDREHTLGDFYSLDLHKCEEWKTIIPCDLQNEEWIESESDDDEDDDEDENDQDSDSEDEEMENTC